MQTGVRKVTPAEPPLGRCQAHQEKVLYQARFKCANSPAGVESPQEQGCQNISYAGTRQPSSVMRTGTFCPPPPQRKCLFCSERLCSTTSTSPGQLHVQREVVLATAFEFVD